RCRRLGAFDDRRTPGWNGSLLGGGLGCLGHGGVSSRGTSRSYRLCGWRDIAPLSERPQAASWPSVILPTANLLRNCNDAHARAGGGDPCVQKFIWSPVHCRHIPVPLRLPICLPSP